ncbi:MAG: uL14 family ribosomal protein [Candidatus Woesearchaeota archaeon]
MKAVGSSVTRGLNIGSKVTACDNSGAKIVQIVSVKGFKAIKGKLAFAGVGDQVTVAVITGKVDIVHKVMPAVVVRQKKMYRRADGLRVCFEDNAVVVLKDEKGNPKGTTVKGPVAKEACVRFPNIAKIASVIV